MPGHDRRPAVGRTFRDVNRPLGDLRVWRFGLYYIVVFGAYVALALWLPHYYVDVYGVDLRTAGFLTALFIFPASLLRPLGGYLSDRLGPRPVTYSAFIVMCGAFIWLSLGVPDRALHDPDHRRRRDDGDRQGVRLQVHRRLLPA